MDMEKCFDIVQEDLKSQLTSFALFKTEERAKREMVWFSEDNTSHEGEYEIPLLVSTIGGIPIAEIYDVENEGSLLQFATKTYYNVVQADTQPAFIFFHYSGKWKGCSMYSRCEEKDNALSYKNAYGKQMFNFSSLSDTSFTFDIKTRLWDITFNEIIKILVDFCSHSNFDSLLIQGLKEKIDEWFNKYGTDKDLKERVMDFLSSLQVNQHPFEISQNGFRFKKEVEDRLFQSILGKLSISSIIRFTTLKSLAALLQNHSHRMWSIVSMNDKTECSYSSQEIYMDGNDVEIKKDDNDSIDTYLNNYITSCSFCKEDDLTMWRLYGDNTKGVALVYEINSDELPNDFYLSPVSYAEIREGKRYHESLDFIKFLLMTIPKVCHRKFYLKRWWNIWQRFFKDEKYSIEQEVRLLYSPQNLPRYDHWMLSNDNVFSPYIDFSLTGESCFPLRIKKIILGPNCPEREANKTIIKALINDMVNFESDVEVIENLHFRP